MKFFSQFHCGKCNEPRSGDEVHEVKQDGDWYLACNTCNEIVALNLPGRNIAPEPELTVAKDAP